MTKSLGKRSKTRRWIENCLLLAGIAAIGVWVVSIATPDISQDWENWVFDREVRGELATVTEYLAAKKEQVIGATRGWWGLPPASPRSVPALRVIPKTARSPIIRTNDLVGRLSIPRLHLSAIVREGVGEGTLGLAVGHIPNTALPGQLGNVGVAGHRDTLFRGLREIRKNDVVRFETFAGTYVYQVGSTEIVQPQDVSVLRANQAAELTLVTCYPFSYIGSAPDRFIVKASQVSQGPVEQHQLHSVLRETARQVDRVAGDRNSARKINFSVSRNHSRQLAPGISLGVTETDAADHRVSGWVWFMPDRRTIWLRHQDAREPVVFYGHEDGRRRQLLITAVTESTVTGYLLQPGE